MSVKSGLVRLRAFAWCAVLARLVGRMSAPLPLRKPQDQARPDSQQAHVQEFRGAPGWNRTRDTRFRNRAAGLLGGGQSDAIVLRSPSFWTSAVFGRGRACWAVMRRLVGSMSARDRELSDGLVTERTGEQGPGAQYTPGVAAPSVEFTTSDSPAMWSTALNCLSPARSLS